MSVLWRCCLRALKENKRRTIVTILGVALATALITAVACTATSAIATGIACLKQTNGDWHGRFSGVSGENLKYFRENQSLEGVWIAKRMGYAYLNDFDNVVLKVLSPEEDFYDHVNVELLDGRLPEKEGEILLGRRAAETNEKVRVGDQVTLFLGDEGYDFISDDYTLEDYVRNSILVREEKTYQVVGILKTSDTSTKFFSRNGHNCNEAIAYVCEKSEKNLYDVLVRYRKDSLKNYAQINQALLDVSPELYQLVYKTKLDDNYRFANAEERKLAHQRAEDFAFNEYLAILEEAPRMLIKNSFYQLTFIVIILLSVILFLFIILAGVFCIDNSFDVSFMERIRFYGMLASVGTTKRQKRCLVWMEAFIIGVIGIPLGILLGIFLTMGLVSIANAAIAVYLKRFHFTVIFGTAWWGILVAVVMATFMVCMSAMGSAVHASKIMPIEAIRMNDVVKKGKKKQKSFKTPKLIKKLFGIGGAVAWQNFKRSKVKYRATVTSIAVSVSLFLGLSFISPLFDMFQADIQDLAGGKWVLETMTYGGFRETARFSLRPEITDSEVYVGQYMNCEEGAVLPYDEGAVSDRTAQTFYVYALEQRFFERYCKDLGLDPKDMDEQGIVQASRFKEARDENGVLVKVPERFATVREGTVICGDVYASANKVNPESGSLLEIKIACQTDELPGDIRSMGNEGTILVIVSENFALKNYDFFERAVVHGNYACDDAYQLEEDFNALELDSYNTVNYMEYSDIIKFVQVLVFILLICFITVIILIGVTNVINAVSTNMELRSPEFAKLKAIGMTEKQFGTMLWTEGFFIGGKGLFFGIPIGYFISYALYRYYWEAMDKTFAFGLRIPILQTIFAVLTVAVTLWLVLFFAKKRFERKNVIDTIRSENT